MSSNQPSPSQKVIKQYAEIRHIVAYLGEKEQFAWWATTTLSATGRKYHSMLFPRSATLSTTLAATKAAETHHDDLLGRKRSFHLFRMPSEVEQSFHAHYRNDTDTFNVYGKDNALARLVEIAGEEKQVAEGPVQVGTQKQIRATKSIQALAGHYAHAFKTGVTVIPFFADA
ncbi:MAG: BrxE family protein [Gammaproteobacteria bacterium]|nr:BrxE family protein [Gammaproteobacteria bacterium]